MGTPRQVRALLAKRLPGFTISKLAGCWYFWGPGAERMFSTSLNTYRLDGDPAAWVDAITSAVEAAGVQNDF